MPIRSQRTFCFRLRIHCDIEAGVVGVRAFSRLRRRGQQTRRRGGGDWVFAGSSERGTMRATTHRCGRARARQTDFPPRNHSIPHHSFLNPLSFSHYFQITIHFLLLFWLFIPLSVFLPCPLSPFTSIFVTFAPTASPRPARTLSPSPSLFLTFSPHSVQYNVGACTEWFAAQLSVQTSTLITRIYVDHRCRS